MPEVSSVFRNVLRLESRKTNLVCEIYSSDYAPASPYGHDPADALQCFAPVSGITFRGRTYIETITKFTEADKHGGITFNKVSVTFDNIPDPESGTAYVRDFIFAQEFGVEGYQLVVRLLSRSVSVNLDDSWLIFWGKIDKTPDGNKTEITVNCTEHLGSVDVEIPRRTFGPTDLEGRSLTDPLNEAFPNTPQTFDIVYRDKVPSTSFFGRLLGKMKSVIKNQQFSTHTSLSDDKAVPEVIGRAQLLLLNIASKDGGSYVYAVYAACDGGSYGIEGYSNRKILTQGFSDYFPPVYRFGEAGGSLTPGREQIPVPSAPDLPGNRWYSRTAWEAGFMVGSKVDQDDPAPDLSQVILGHRILLPDNSNEFTVVGWSDSPAYHLRNFFTDQYKGNLNPAFVDDSSCIETASYQSQFLEDVYDTDRTLLDVTQSGVAGTQYKIYRPTSTVSSFFWKAVYLAIDDARARLLEADYQYHDPTDPDPTLTPAKVYRRRFSVNGVISEKQRLVDYINNVLCPAGRMFYRQSGFGKYEICQRKPFDNSLLRSNIAAGVSNIPIRSILAWRNNLKGQILIGAYQSNVEAHTVTGSKFSTDGNSISLAVTGSLTASGATLAGCDGDQTPATATVAVSAAVGTFTVTLDGYQVSYTANGDDTTSTIALWLRAIIKAHIILNKYIDASWDSASPDVVTLTAKLGTLQIDSPTLEAHKGLIASPSAGPSLSSSSGDLLAGVYKVAHTFKTASGQTLIGPISAITITDGHRIGVGSVSLPTNATGVNWYVSEKPDSDNLLHHSTNNGSGFSINELPADYADSIPVRDTSGEEVLRVSAVFADKANTHANLSRSNIIQGTFKWSSKANRTSTNRVVVKYNDSAYDYRETELRIEKKAHYRQVKKWIPKEISGSLIDNHMQASLIARQVLEEETQGNLAGTLASDGEALLIPEGELIAVTHNAGGDVFKLLPFVIDSSRISGSSHPTITFDCHRYTTSMYDDIVPIKSVPMPTSPPGSTAAPPVPTSVLLSPANVNATTSSVHGTFSFGDYRFAQTARVFMKKGAGSYLELASGIVPDANNFGTFDAHGLVPDTYSFKVQAEYGSLASSQTAPESITTSTDGSITINTIDADNVDAGLFKIGGGASLSKHLSGTATWNPPDIPDGSFASTTVTVTGAALGDEATCAFSVALPDGVTISAAVSAANTVRVTLRNNSGSSQDLASGTVRASIWRH